MTDPITGPDLVLEGMLAIARRETLVLAAAVQREDDGTTVIAAARLRWALANAHQFAARSLVGWQRAGQRLPGRSWTFAGR